MWQWLAGLSTEQQFFFWLAIGSTLLSALQIGATFLGGDTDTDFDPDTSIDTPIEGVGSYFTFRNFVNFLMGFSWTTLGLLPTGKLIAYPAGIGVGLLFVAISVVLMQMLSRLQSSGTVQLEQAIEQTATVSLAIPAHGAGYGKVRLYIENREIEVQAMTQGDRIQRGEQVFVTDVSGDKMIVVRSVL